jgi:hypothetical protein
MTVETTIRNYEKNVGGEERGIFYASCLDPNSDTAGGEIYLVIPLAKFKRFVGETAFLYELFAEGKRRYEGNTGYLEIKGGDIDVNNSQGGLGVHEEMRRIVAPLLKKQFRIAFSIKEVFSTRPTHLCELAPSIYDKK